MTDVPPNFTSRQACDSTLISATASLSTIFPDEIDTDEESFLADCACGSFHCDVRTSRMLSASFDPATARAAAQPRLNRSAAADRSPAWRAPATGTTLRPRPSILARDPFHEADEQQVEQVDGEAVRAETREPAAAFGPAKSHQRVQRWNRRQAEHGFRAQHGGFAVQQEAGQQRQETGHEPRAVADR